MKARRRAVVIGAGLGGLAAAARLAHAGWRVQVFEQETSVGGRAQRLRFDGYDFDTGPTILLMPEVLQQLFADCGRRPEDYLKLQQLEPNYRAHFADGSAITMSSNLSQLTTELSRLDPRAPEQLQLFLSDTARFYRLARHQFIDRNFDQLTDFISPLQAMQLWRRGGLQKLYRFVSRYFDDPRLRMLFSFQSMYLGVSPFAAPAIYSLVAYMETALGVWYPSGGLSALPDAIAKLAQDNGGTIHLRAPVRRVLSEQGLVRGVELVSGERVNADVVISNADVPYTYRELLTPEPQPSAAKLQRLHQAGSAVLFYWGVRHDCAGLLHHNLFFSADFKRTLDEIFTERRVPRQPAFYVNVASKTEPARAPAGRQAVYVLVPVPNLNSTVDWSRAVSRLRRQVLARLKQTLQLDLEQVIATERILSPSDFAQRWHLADGTAFGLSHLFFQSGYFRPANYVSETIGVYLAGASTIPGSGVPMVLLSGKLAVERIFADVAAGRI